MSKEYHYKSANYFKQDSISATDEGVVKDVVIFKCFGVAF